MSIVARKRLWRNNGKIAAFVPIPATLKEIPLPFILMVPDWLHLLSISALAVGAFCALLLSFDVWRHPQHMWIMNVVWPVNALFAGPFALWGYFKYGRLATHEMAKPAMERDEEPPSKRLTPFPVMVGKGTAHCGSGCTLGDIAAEWLVFSFPVIAIWFGYRHTIFAFLANIPLSHFIFNPFFRIKSSPRGLSITYLRLRSASCFNILPLRPCADLDCGKALLRR